MKTFRLKYSSWPALMSNRKEDINVFNIKLIISDSKKAIVIDGHEGYITKTCDVPCYEQGCSFLLSINE